MPATGVTSAPWCRVPQGYSRDPIACIGSQCLARQMECPHRHGTAGRTRGGYKYTYRSYIALFPVHHVADWSPKGLWLQIIVSPFL